MSKISFGKHKGEDISDLPIDYLKWLEEQDWLDKWGIRSEVQHEIEIQEGDRPGKGFVKPKYGV